MTRSTYVQRNRLARGAILSGGMLWIFFVIVLALGVLLVAFCSLPPSVLSFAFYKEFIEISLHMLVFNTNSKAFSFGLHTGLLPILKCLLLENGEISSQS